MNNAIGRTRKSICLLDPARAAALHATLGLEGPPRQHGAPLPPFFHQIYFWHAEPPERLGRDGHPETGRFIPDAGLPRRMWAGGRLEFRAPIRAGIEAERLTEIIRVERKSGRTGKLAFVTLRHDIRQSNRLCVTEEQELVYCEAADPSAPRPPPQSAPQDSEPEARHFDATLLFRYSALTFNGHRIHYDADYARRLEGYDGLVVHGPLLAQMLMLKADAAAPLRRFAFRSLRALSVAETAVLNRDGRRLWIRNGDGALITEAEADT